MLILSKHPGMSFLETACGHKITSLKWGEMGLYGKWAFQVLHSNQLSKSGKIEPTWDSGEFGSPLI